VGKFHPTSPPPPQLPCGLRDLMYLFSAVTATEIKATSHWRTY
jgi:hypothetical protein